MEEPQSVSPLSSQDVRLLAGVPGIAAVASKVVPALLVLTAVWSCFTLINICEQNHKVHIRTHRVTSSISQQQLQQEQMFGESVPERTISLCIYSFLGLLTQFLKLGPRQNSTHKNTVYTKYKASYISCKDSTTSKTL